MMRRYVIFLTTLITLSQWCLAQSVTVVSDERLAIPAEGAVYSPVISPVGDYILVTSESDAGLQKYDLATGELSVVTTDEGAGYQPRISPDGKMVVYKQKTYVGRLRYNAVKAVDISTGETATVVEPSRGVTAYDVRGGQAVALKGGNVVKKDIVGRRTEVEPTLVSADDSDLIITRGGATKRLNPRNTTCYLWVSLSPDGERVLFAVPEDGMIAYTCDTDGGRLCRLGRMSAPTWMGNDYVVGMVDEDDGEVITASVIVAASSDGSWYGTLTDGTEICMYPTGTADASKIVYNTGGGAVHLMTVTTK